MEVEKQLENFMRINGGLNWVVGVERGVDRLASSRIVGTC